MMTAHRLSLTQAGRWIAFTCVALFATAFAGCVSKAKADAHARAAFIAGQQQAMLQWQQNQNRGPIVTIMGPVRNPTVPWTANLTLVKALLAAQYYGGGDPGEIVLIRSGEATHINVQQLLNGNDIALQPQDIIQVKPSGPAANDSK